MSVITDVTRVKKLVRKTMLLDVLREFPGLVEEELQWVLENWRDPIAQRYVREHGCLPVEARDLKRAEEDKELRPALSPAQLQQRPRRCGAEKPVVNEIRALRMIEDMAPDIPPEELDRSLYIRISINRRTHAEINFVIANGYFPESEPDKSQADIEYFQRHGSWPQPSGAVRAPFK